MSTAQSVATTPSTAAPPKRGWRTAWASALGLACGPSVLLVMSFGVFITPLDKEFGWGVPAIALGASLLSITTMIASPVQGLLVDRFGGRKVVLVSAPFFSLALLTMYFLPDSLTVFYLAWVVIPLCGLGLWPVSYLRLTAGWFESRLGLALGVANSGIGIGTVIVPIITAVLIWNYGWRVAYLGLGLIALIAFPVALFLLAEPSPRRAGIPVGGDTLRDAAGRRVFWYVLAAFFLLGIVGSTIVVHQVRILLEAGVSQGVANLVPVALGVALIVARIGTGWLLDRFSVSRVMSGVLVGGVVALLLLASGPGVATGLLAAALGGLLIGAEFDVLSYLIPRYFGRRAFGKIYGITFAAFQLASAIAAYTVGLSRVGYGSYTPALLTMVAVCAVCAGLFLSLGPYRHAGVER